MKSPFNLRKLHLIKQNKITHINRKAFQMDLLTSKQKELNNLSQLTVVTAPWNFS